MMDLREKIEKFEPFNEQERADKEYFLKFMDTFDDVLSRDNIFGHFSASGFIVNKDRTKMLVVYHLVNDAWIYPGGHADGEEDLKSVAIREAKEETGLKVKLLDDEIFGIQTGPVSAHVKRGKFVPTHIHFDVIYLMEADESEDLVYKKDESKGVKWIPFEDVTSEEVFAPIRPIHKKLIEKLATKM